MKNCDKKCKVYLQKKRSSPNLILWAQAHYKGKNCRVVDNMLPFSKAKDTLKYTQKVCNA